MKKNKIMVSVFMLTYNHSKYIRKAIDSVLSQNVDFEYEIVIADDCSTDGTQEIITEYQKKFPELIRPILREKNVGASMNSLDGKKKCRGKYIALLEGDDYWIDDQKLSIQIDFLEKNKDYVGCAHKNIIVDENCNQINEDNMFEKNYKEIYTFDDMKKYGHGFHTATLVYKNFYLDENNERDYVFLNATVGDVVLMYILLDIGNIYIFNRYTSAWRCILNQNNWSSVAKSKPVLMAFNAYKNHMLLNNYFNGKRSFGFKKYDYICSFYIIVIKNNIFRHFKKFCKFLKLIGLIKFFVSVFYMPFYIIKKTVNRLEGKYKCNERKKFKKHNS